MLPFPKLDTERVIVFRPKYNAPGKNDVDGAFTPGAQLFCDYYGVSKSENIHVVNNFLSENRQALFVLRTIAQRKKAPNVFVFFCHGYDNKLQFGIRSPNLRHKFSNRHIYIWDQFCSVLATVADPYIILYACSTGDDPYGKPDTAPGSGNGSFGDSLRDELSVRGSYACSVFTHTTAGPAWSNPYIKILRGSAIPSARIGGDFVVKPGSRAFTELRKRLKAEPGEPHYGLAWELPFYSQKDFLTLNLLMEGDQCHRE